MLSTSTQPSLSNYAAGKARAPDVGIRARVPDIQAQAPVAQRCVALSTSASATNLRHDTYFALSKQLPASQPQCRPSSYTGDRRLLPLCSTFAPASTMPRPSVRANRRVQCPSPTSRAVRAMQICDMAHSMLIGYGQQSSHVSRIRLSGERPDSHIYCRFVADAPNGRATRRRVGVSRAVQRAYGVHLGDGASPSALRMLDGRRDDQAARHRRELPRSTPHTLEILT